MGLIDQIREKKDSWSRRLEEHRLETVDDENRETSINEEEEMKRIEENRKRVGVFDK